jgi:hypothetical protein
VPMRSVSRNLPTNLTDTLSRSGNRLSSEVLAKRGVNAKAARLILKDVEDATEESIDSWLRDNGDLIGYTPQEQNEDTQKDLATLRQQDILTQSGITPDKAVDMATRLDNAGSMDELLHLLRNP